MNFLAHLFLSHEWEEIMVGNFLADFLKNKEVAQLPQSIQKGIDLHRKIDHFTDNHPLVRQGTKRLQPLHHKYSPVVIDVFYDYLLFKNWDHFSVLSFEDFSQKIYGILNRYDHIYPIRIKDRIQKMVNASWLYSYTSFNGLAFTFSKIKERVRFDNVLDQATLHLQNDLDLYNQEFLVFFKELNDVTNQVWINELA